MGHAGPHALGRRTKRSRPGSGPARPATGPGQWGRRPVSAGVAGKPRPPGRALGASLFRAHPRAGHPPGLCQSLARPAAPGPGPSPAQCRRRPSPRQFRSLVHPGRHPRPTRPVERCRAIAATLYRPHPHPGHARAAQRRLEASGPARCPQRLGGQKPRPGPAMAGAHPAN